MNQNGVHSKLLKLNRGFLQRRQPHKINYSQRSTIVITRAQQSKFNPNEHLWPILPQKQEFEARVAERYERKYGHLPRAQDLDQITETLKLNTSESASIREPLSKLSDADLLERARNPVEGSLPELVWYTYETLCARGLEENLTADNYRRILRGLYELPLPDSIAKVSSLLNKLKDLGESPTISDHNALFSVLFMAGDLEGMESLYKLMGTESIEPDATTSKYLLKAFGTMRGAQDMSLLYLEHLIPKDGSPLDASLIAEILEQLNSDGFHDQVLAWFDKSTKHRHRGVVRRFAPDAACFRHALKACVLSGFPERAFELFDRMEGEFGVTPDKRCLELLLKIALTREHLRHRAPEVSKLLTEGKHVPDTGSFENYMSMLTRCGHADKSVQVYRDMVKHGVLPKRKTYTVLMRALADLGTLEQVLVLFEELLEYGVPPDQHMFVTLIFASGCGGAPDSIDGMLRLVRQHGARSDIIAYHTAMDAYCKRGMTDKAWYVFEQLVEMGFKPSPRTYHTLIKIYGMKDMYHAAEDVLEIMTRDKMPPTPLTYFIYSRFLLRSRMKLRLNTLYKGMKLAFRDEPLLQEAFANYHTGEEFFTAPSTPGHARLNRKSATSGDIRKKMALYEEYLFSLPKRKLDTLMIPGMNINVPMS